MAWPAFWTLYWYTLSRADQEATEEVGEDTSDNSQLQIRDCSSVGNSLLIGSETRRRHGVEGD